MPDFVPPPPVVDNWRDHSAWTGPTCRVCAHPLWAPTSVDYGSCSAHANGGDTPNIHYGDTCGIEVLPYLVDHRA